jgi:superfamily II DNA or RNA helicase
MHDPGPIRILAGGFEGLRLPYPLRKHQREALEAVDRAVQAGQDRAWVVLPPGAGKTLVGLEVARCLGRRTVVLGPNTAIQTQWAEGWNALVPGPDHPARAGVRRDLTTQFTALTYQSLASFLPDDEVDEEGERHSLLARLHPHGQELIERLKAEPEVTLVLDECHHLLELWGRLLDEVLAELPNAFVLGLTATPPYKLTADQQELVDSLFGGIVYQASIPAVVREGHLAPFAELAWLTTPTPVETDYIARQAERFAELVHGLTDPGFGSVGFLAWLDARFVAATRTVSWQELSADLPELCDAALRLHNHGLLALPEGARVTERHRPPPTADDWVQVIDDWARNHLLRSGQEQDEQVVEAVRRALPSVGYRWTRRGIRRGRSPVDRVLARSEAKSQALVEIVAAEHRNLAERLRMLVLCDHERAAAALPVDLRDVLPTEAGSARLALHRLADDPTTASLSPLLVTGSRVAADPATLHRLREDIARADAALAGGLTVEEDADGLAELRGRWDSRDWVPWVTRFFEAGRCQVLIGTRALLGEGWDAPAVTGLVDLTAATTSTAVVQTRGRALRLDPAWPEKVALTWSVVCVTDRHPKGGADWSRFVRKHEGFFGVDEDGAVVDGVAHVSDRFSPYAPPPVADLHASNAAMLVLSEDRAGIAARWKVGQPYVDTRMHIVRVLPARPERAGATRQPAAVVVRPAGLDVRTDALPAPWRPHPAAVLSGLVVLAGLVPFLPAGAAAALAAVAGLALQIGVAGRRGRARVEAAARAPTVAQVASAVADGLHEAGLSPVGAGAVQVDVDHEGEYRCALGGVPPEVSARFAGALDEALSPMASPRYVLPRYVVMPPLDGIAGWADGLRAATGRLRPSGEVWHSVPTALGTRAEHAKAFARAWGRWVGGGDPVLTRTPQGEGVLATHRGSDPFDVTTVLRVQWR